MFHQWCFVDANLLSQKDVKETAVKWRAAEQTEKACTETRAAMLHGYNQRHSDRQDLLTPPQHWQQTLTSHAREQNRRKGRERGLVLKQKGLRMMLRTRGEQEAAA